MHWKLSIPDCTREGDKYKQVSVVMWKLLQMSVGYKSEVEGT